MSYLIKFNDLFDYYAEKAKFYLLALTLIFFMLAVYKLNQIASIQREILETGGYTKDNFACYCSEITEFQPYIKLPKNQELNFSFDNNG